MPRAAMCCRLPTPNPETPVAAGSLAPGWFRAGELAGDDDGWLEHGLDRMATCYHAGMDLRTRAAFLIGRYALDVSALGVSAYLRESRVPNLTPDNLALRFETDTREPDGLVGQTERLRVRLLSGRMAVLPDDPAAERDDVIAVADRDALRDRFRAEFETHLAPLIDRLKDRTRLSRRAQWRLAGDAVTASFLDAAEATGHKALGQREGLAFVRAPASPMNNPQVGYITRSVSRTDAADPHTIQRTFRARGGCCRFYTLPQGECCTMCVLRDAGERDRRIHEYLRGKLDDQAPPGQAGATE